MSNKLKNVVPIIRSLPSYISISKGIYSFHRLKSISHIDTSNPLVMNYFQLLVRPNANIDCPNYHTVLDISHLDYPFFYLPYNFYHPDRFRQYIEYAKRNEIKNIRNEFCQMLDKYKIRYNIDYYKIDDNIYINFTNKIEYIEEEEDDSELNENSSIKKIRNIVDSSNTIIGC